MKSIPYNGKWNPIESGYNAYMEWFEFMNGADGRKRELANFEIDVKPKKKASASTSARSAKKPASANAGQGSSATRKKPAAGKSTSSAKTAAKKPASSAKKPANGTKAASSASKKSMNTQKAASAKKALDSALSCSYETGIVRKLSALTDRIFSKAEELETALISLDKAEDIGAESVMIRDTILSLMGELRVPCDEAETLTSKAYWPMPTYADLLFGVK